MCNSTSCIMEAEEKKQSWRLLAGVCSMREGAQVEQMSVSIVRQLKRPMCLSRPNNPESPPKTPKHFEHYRPKTLQPTFMKFSSFLFPPLTVHFRPTSFICPHPLVVAGDTFTIKLSHTRMTSHSSINSPPQCLVLEN